MTWEKKNIQELREEFYFDLFERMFEKDREKLRIYYSNECPTVSFVYETENGMRQFNFWLDGLCTANDTDGLDIEEISNKLFHVFNAGNRLTANPADKFADYEEIKELLAFRVSEEEMTEEELEKYIVRKDNEVTRILFAYEINAEGNMEWHKITKDMASKWKKDLNGVTEQAANNTDTFIPMSAWSCKKHEDYNSAGDLYYFLRSIGIFRMSADRVVRLDINRVMQ